MSAWAPVRDDVYDGPSNSTAAQWNDGPADDKWNDNAGANGGRATAPFDEGGVNGFDAAAGGDDARGGGGGGTCFNCGQEGHNKADCPNPRVQKCRHCDEEGHMVRDCPTAPPREFTGECRHCHEEGHMAKDCPTKPAEVCRNCQEEGHTVVECKNPRKIDRSHLKEVDAEIAWNKISEGVRENDMDDVKEAIQLYVKACPDTTYVDLEIAFRTQEIGIYLIAMESQSMMSTLTNMDLQGNLDKKYRVNYRFDPKPARPREREFWPKDKEENMSRLEDAGEPVNRGLSKCTNCDELGHISKNCPQEKMEKERVVIMCFNCNEHLTRPSATCRQVRNNRAAARADTRRLTVSDPIHQKPPCEPIIDNLTGPEPRVAGPDVECRKCGETGHFSRDCPQGGGGGGGGGRGCFNCGEEGHSARDCTEPKKMICRNCNQEGHRSNECPEPKDMSKVQCRNCDEYGHDSRECPKPRDYSRVQCQNCGEFGHTKIRCNKQTVAPDDFGGGSTGNIDNDSFKAGGGGNEEAREPASDDWMKEAAGNSGAAGNGGWNASGPGEVVW